MSASFTAPARDLIRAIVHGVMAADPRLDAEVRLHAADGRLKISVDSPSGEIVSSFEVPGESEGEIPPLEIRGTDLKALLAKGTTSGTPTDKVTLRWDEKAHLRVEYPERDYLPEPIGSRATERAAPEAREPEQTIRTESAPAIWEHLARFAGREGHIRFIRFAADHEIGIAVRQDGSSTAVRFGKSFSASPATRTIDPEDTAVVDLSGSAVTALARAANSETYLRKEAMSLQGRKKSEASPVGIVLSTLTTGEIEIQVEGGFHLILPPLPHSTALDRESVGETAIPLPNMPDEEPGEGWIGVRREALTTLLGDVLDRLAANSLHEASLAEVEVTLAVSADDEITSLRLDIPRRENSPILNASEYQEERFVSASGDLSPWMESAPRTSEPPVARCSAVDLARALESFPAMREIQIRAERGALLLRAHGATMRLADPYARALDHPLLQVDEVSRIMEEQRLYRGAEIESLRKEEEERFPAPRPAEQRRVSGHRAARADDGPSPWGEGHHDRMLAEHKVYPYTTESTSSEALLRVANGEAPLADSERQRLRHIAYSMHYPVTRHWARQAKSRGNPIAIDDLRSIAHLALWKSVTHWKPEADRALLVYAKSIFLNDLATEVTLMGGFQTSFADTMGARFARIAEVGRQIRHETGRPPGAAEIFERIGDWLLTTAPRGKEKVTSAQERREQVLEFIEDVQATLESAYAPSHDAQFRERTPKRNQIPLEYTALQAREDLDIEDPSFHRLEERARLERFLRVLPSAEEADAAAAMFPGERFPLSKEEWALYTGVNPGTLANRLKSVDHRLRDAGLEGPLRGSRFGR